jgi:hypothetical protein
MPNLIERARLGLADSLLGNEKRKLQATLDTIINAYFVGPWQLPPQELAKQLREVDPWLLTTMLDQLGWETIGGLGYSTDTDAERQRAEQESVRLYKYSPLAQWSVWLWTNWALGDKVTVTPNDEGAAEVWEEFWEADRNAALLGEDVIQELSNWLLLRGNQYFVFFSSEVDGETTVRRIRPGEISEIVTDPDDGMSPWFYKREWTPTSGSTTGQAQTMYYPDWQIFFEGDIEEKWSKLVSMRAVDGNANRADRANSNGEEILGGGRTGTVACLLHVNHNCKDDESLLGWPLLTTGRHWIEAHKRFTQDRLTVAAGKAMFVRRKKVQGGSRALSSIADTINTTLSSTNYTERNPRAVAGSVELDNAMIDTTDLPMTTGASDAKADNEMFFHQASLATGLFPTSAGLDTARWATALQMDKAQAMLFARYGTFWSAQWRKMVKIVLSFKERYGGASFEDKSAQVSTDTFSLSDFPDVASSIGSLVSTALTPMVDNGTIPTEAAREIERALWQISLQALGVDNADELTDEELWEPEEEEPEEKTPAQLLPYIQPAGEQPQEQPPPPEEEPQEESLVAEIAAVIQENMGRGDVGAQVVAEWAIAQLVEGGPGSGWHGPPKGTHTAAKGDVKVKRSKKKNRVER